MTVIQRSEPELGLSVDQERIWDHMPRPAKLDGIDVDTKLLGTLVHWVMCNNLLTKLNTYSAIQGSRDFDVSCAKLKRVITGIKQHGGSYYKKLCREQEEGEMEKSGRKCKSLNPVDVALAKKRKYLCQILLYVSIVVSHTTLVRNSWITSTRSTQVNKQFLLVCTVANLLTSIQST